MFFNKKTRQIFQLILTMLVVCMVCWSPLGVLNTYASDDSSWEPDDGYGPIYDGEIEDTYPGESNSSDPGSSAETDSGIVAQGLEFVYNIIGFIVFLPGWIIDNILAWNDSIDLSISSMVYGRVYVGEDNIHWFGFELSYGNPWGVLGAGAYSLFRNLAWGALPFIALALILVRKAFNQDVRTTMSVKELFSSIVLFGFSLYLIPQMVDLAILIRDMSLVVVNNTLSTGFGSNTDVLTAARDTYNAEGGLLNAFLYTATAFASFSFIASYVGIALKQTGLFGLYPVIGLIGMWKKRVTEAWATEFFGNLLVPLIDALLLCIPFGFKQIAEYIVSGTSSVFTMSGTFLETELPVGFSWIIIIMLGLIVPTRDAILRLIGVQGVVQRGRGLGGVMAAAMMMTRMAMSRRGDSGEMVGKEGGASAKTSADSSVTTLSRSSSIDREQMLDRVASGGDSITPEKMAPAVDTSMELDRNLSNIENNGVGTRGSEDMVPSGAGLAMGSEEGGVVPGDYGTVSGMDYKEIDPAEMVPTRGDIQTQGDMGGSIEATEPVMNSITDTDGPVDAGSITVAEQSQTVPESMESPSATVENLTPSSEVSTEVYRPSSGDSSVPEGMSAPSSSASVYTNSPTGGGNVSPSFSETGGSMPSQSIPVQGGYSAPSAKTEATRANVVSSQGSHSPERISSVPSPSVPSPSVSPTATTTTINSSTDVRRSVVNNAQEVEAQRVRQEKVNAAREDFRKRATFNSTRDKGVLSDSERIRLQYDNLKKNPNVQKAVNISKKVVTAGAVASGAIVGAAAGAYSGDSLNGAVLGGAGVVYAASAVSQASNKKDSKGKPVNNNSNKTVPSPEASSANNNQHRESRPVVDRVLRQDDRLYKEGLEKQSGRVQERRTQAESVSSRADAVSEKADNGNEQNNKGQGGS